MIEEADFTVRATLTVTIPFSPIERPTPLTEFDAIENAKGTMPERLWEDLESEGWEINWKAVRL
jgi:hypothetical protein